MASTHEDESEFFSKFDFEYGIGSPAICPPLTFTEYRAELYKRDKRRLAFGLHGGKIKRREQKGGSEPTLQQWSLKHAKTIIKAPERPQSKVREKKEKERDKEPLHGEDGTQKN